MKCFKVPLKQSENLFSAYRLHIQHWKCFYEVTLSLADEESGNEIHGSYTFHKCAFWQFFFLPTRRTHFYMCENLWTQFFSYRVCIKCNRFHHFHLCGTSHIQLTFCNNQNMHVKILQTHAHCYIDHIPFFPSAFYFPCVDKNQQEFNELMVLLIFAQQKYIRTHRFWSGRALIRISQFANQYWI